MTRHELYKQNLKYYQTILLSHLMHDFILFYGTLYAYFGCHDYTILVVI